MDIERRKRLQIFLTIMDTLHDFTDEKRNPSDYLRARIMMTLLEPFDDACEKERDVLGKYNTNYSNFKSLYKNIYHSGEFKLPTNYQQQIREIVLSILREFYDIEIKTISVKNMSNVDLYSHVQEMTHTKYVKYVLDKNCADNNIFCIQPDKVNELVSGNVQGTMQELLKTIWRGKFYEYDNQNNRYSGTEDLNTEIGNIRNYFGIAGDDGKVCILNKDVCNYELEKSKNELLFFDKFGVKKSGDEYIVFHSVENKDYIVDVGKFPRNSLKGLSLFLKAFIEEGKTIAELEKITIKTMAKVFKISCSFFDLPDYYRNKVLEMNPKYYMYALYDLKRSMDYLQVKACSIANSKNVFENTSCVFVSSDRLAMLYSLTNEVPTLLTKLDGSAKVFKCSPLKRFDEGELVGGLSFDSKVIFNDKLYLEKENVRRFVEMDKIPFDHILYNNEDSDMFGKFLKIYAQKCGQDSMSFIWYMTYKTIFYFIY